LTFACALGALGCDPSEHFYVRWRFADPPPLTSEELDEASRRVIEEELDRAAAVTRSKEAREDESSTSPTEDQKGELLPPDHEDEERNREPSRAPDTETNEIHPIDEDRAR